MSITLVCYFGTLMGYARDYANAKESGDKKKIKEAYTKWKSYERLCRKADQMLY